MTIQPDSIRFYHPNEADDRPRTLFSEYDDYTTPDGPYTVTDEAMHVVLRHIQEFVSADTEDPFVRYCCLVADLGYKVPEEGFWELVDAYDDPMTPAYAEHYNGLLRRYLKPYTEERP